MATPEPVRGARKRGSKAAPRQAPRPASRSKTSAVAPDVMNLAELAGYLRLPEKPLQKLAEQGGLPARQVGGEWRFLKDAVRAWLGHAGDVDPVPPKPGTAATILQSAAFIDDEDDLQEQLKLLRGYREESRR